MRNNGFPGKRSRKRSPIAQPVLMGAFMGVISVSHGQSVLTPGPTFSATPPGVQADLETREGYISTGQIGSILSSPTSLFHWGPVQGHPHFNYGITYGTGIQSGPGVRNESLIQTLAPGISFFLGKQWSLDYTPTLTYYSSQNLKSTLGHAVSLSGGAHYEDWLFSVSQSYSSSDNPNVQTGTQAETSSYVTALSADYAFNSKYSLDSTFSQTINQSANYNNSTSWTLAEFLNYQFFPRLTAGVGTTIGYDQLSQGSDDWNEALQLRLNWRTFDWLSLSVHGGAEDRQYVTGNLAQNITPIFGADITAKLAPFTSVTLSGSRSISPSLLNNQSTIVTTTSLALTQRLLGALNFNSSLTYTLDEYQATESILSVNRTDTLYAFNAGLSYSFLKSAYVSGSYSYSKNNSSATGFNYISSQVGLNVGYRF